MLKYNEHHSGIKELLRELSETVESQVWREHLELLHKNHDCKYINSSLDNQYKYLQSLEQLNGGMGSINDTPHTHEISTKIDQLFSKIHFELIELWKKQGNDSYEQKSFNIFPSGTQVVLIEGEALYINSDGSYKQVPEQSHLKNKVWLVNHLSNPDITNMPVYCLYKTVKNGTQIKYARHTSIAQINH